MRALIRNIVFVVAILVTAVVLIIPPEKKLRLGKDLRGGVSLIYPVQVAPGDPPNVIAQVIDAIKQRVDPNGLSEITIVQQGQDRIEITMPLPSPSVKKLKETYEAALADMAEVTLDGPQFERIMRLTGDARAAEITRISGKNTAKLEALNRAAGAADEVAAARAEVAKLQGELKAATEAGAEQGRIQELTGRIESLMDKAVSAEVVYEASRDEAIGSVLSPAELRRVLELSDQSRSLTDSATGQRVRRPSPRQQGLQHLREAYKAYEDQINRVVAAYDAYAGQRTRLDDHTDLKRMLKGAGVLDFRITIEPGGHPQEARLRREMRERGPRNVRSPDARWYKINKIDTWIDSTQNEAELEADPAGYFAARYKLVAERHNLDYYILAWDTPGSRLTRAEGEWAVAKAYQSIDPQSGFPAISFEMNPRGAVMLSDLTKAHVGKQMAVLLDDEVYTAPTLRSRIGKSGQITGSFSDTEIRYVIRVLAAGSLQAKLAPEPISEVTLAPELGFDNLRRGVWCGIVSLVFIAGFMTVYYFGSGLIAVVALLCNAVLLLGLMSLNKAAFTMPGIAGVILTFGMAVDANVLIYERMREEIKKGLDLRNSVRLGYDRALSAIVDSNVTNLIVCVVLYFVGTQEIRGFAITMSIGVLTTLFSALFITRQIYTALVDFGPVRRISMLPLAVPAIDRFFDRNIDWLRLRYVFWPLYFGVVAFGLCLVAVQGKEMLDTQFRGGTQIVMQLKEESPGTRMTLTRADVEGRFREIGEGTEDEELRNLASSSVLAVDPQADGVTSSRFIVRSLATNPKAVSDTVAAKFGNVLDSQPALDFAGGDAPRSREAPVFQVVSDTLGEDIGRSQYRNDIKPFVGGAAILLEGISPPPSLTNLRDRLERKRTTSEFSDTLSRERTVQVLEGDEQAVTSAVLLVRDPAVSFFDDEARWGIEVAEREWQIVRSALGESSIAASVEVFSPAIAKTFTAQAVVAIGLSFLLIGIYIWVRFGDVRYSMGALVPMVLDVLSVVGAIALAQVLYESSVTGELARRIGLAPFKIDLNMIAALMTIMGYSLNDSIVIMDRIREIRGKLPAATREGINLAVNQTLSRTVITGGTTFIASMILYFYGGEGMRGFAFALIVGLVTGTFSSIALTAPIVWSKKADKRRDEGATPGLAAAAGTPAPALSSV